MCLVETATNNRWQTQIKLQGKGTFMTYCSNIPIWIWYIVSWILDRALSNPAVFTLCPNTPMFPAEPDLMRNKMNVTSFHLSQVGGHTPKARRGSGGTKKHHRQSKVMESNWRLDFSAEEERRNLFGQLPRSSCREYEIRSNKFPPSLKRKYLNSRSQSIYTRMLWKG